MNKKALRIGLITFASIAVLLVLYFSVFKGIIFAQSEIGATKPPIEVNSSVQALNKAFADVAESIVPSVVSIQIKFKSKFHSQNFFDQFRKFFPEWEDFFGNQPREREFVAAGSGVFITSDGYILTNNHVVEKADDIQVITFDKKEYKAKVIGTDPTTDLAVIKIDGEGFKPVYFANMDNIRVGEFVIAVGNPLGLHSTVTSGIISAIGRNTIRLRQSSYSIDYYLQTDAPINPGNSGGGLFNITGSLVGINTAIATPTGSYVGYGFAIPADLAKVIASRLIKYGSARRPILGVQIRNIDQPYAKALGLKDIKGALVNDVVKGSPAEKAGIKVEDLILAVDGKEVKTSSDLQVEIAKRNPGDYVELTIFRDGKTIKKKVKLEEKDLAKIDNEEEKLSFDEEDSKEPTKIEKIGLSVTSIDDKIKKEYDVDYGVLINRVEQGSIADLSGISPNGVITKLDSKEVKSVSDFKKMLNSKHAGDIVRFQIKYKNANLLVALEIPS